MQVVIRYVSVVCLYEPVLLKTLECAYMSTPSPFPGCIPCKPHARDMPVFTIYINSVNIV